MTERRSKKSILEFYQSTIRYCLPNLENLTGNVSENFKKLIKSLNVKENYLEYALDLGYGYGNYTIELVKYGYRVEAIDIISPNFINRKLEQLQLSNFVEVKQIDLELFEPNNKYNFVIAKDVLHFLPQDSVKSLLFQLANLTNKNGWHYLEIFCNIVRESETHNSIFIENEASFSRHQLLSILNSVYRDWSLEIKEIQYSEETYFKANKFIIMANKLI